MLENIVISLVMMAVQLLILDRIIRSVNRQREQRMWTPFRILFFQSIADHHTGLMANLKQLKTAVGDHLGAIRKQGFVTAANIAAMKNEIAAAEKSQSELDKTFFNIIQTVSPSLQPEAAGDCNESLYFSYILNKYSSQLKQLLNELEEVTDWNDRTITSPLLNGLSAKLIALNMIATARLDHFISEFAAALWKREKLHLHNGEILDQRDYLNAIQTEKAVKELSKIPRSTPITNFFDVP